MEAPPSQAAKGGAPCLTPAKNSPTSIFWKINFSSTFFLLIKCLDQPTQKYNIYAIVNIEIILLAVFFVTDIIFKLSSLFDII